ncbi:chemotaxis response regulator protein-glutamate methylesterase [Carnobacteriaceae bacterium 52-44]
MSIKVLTVEDSTLIRTIINNTIKMMDGIELVGTAENGKEALLKIRELKPDVITLDMVMPVMDGLETLEKLREFSNVPVIILSARNDQSTTIRALENGAQDFLTKPESITKNREKFKNELALHIKALANGQPQTTSFSEGGKGKRSLVSPIENVQAIVIGASTGGPKVISTLIQSLPRSLSLPVFIVQHMPKGFTASFAERLNTVSAVPVVEAEDRMPVERGKVYVAPGGYHMVVKNHEIYLLDTEKIHGVKPAVDPLFESVIQNYGKKTLGVLLTGMGKDGAKGCLAIKKAGGYVLAQDERSCVVYGMPKHAAELEAVDELLSIKEIQNTIKEIVKD